MGSPLHNAILESFLLHSRVISDFLYKDTPRKDDVSAADYFSEPDEWQKLRPSKTELIQRLNKRVGKELAHLTQERLSEEMADRGWPIVDIGKDILAAVKVFGNNVSKALLGSKWDKNKQQGCAVGFDFC